MSRSTPARPPAPWNVPGGHRANNFDFLRLLFAVLVIFSHSYSLVGGPLVSEPALGITRGQATLGSLSVAGFFLISGFLIVASWQRSPRLGPFLRRRSIRIYPGFVASMVVMALVVAPLGADAGVATVTAGQLGKLVGQSALLHRYTSPGVFGGLPFPHDINGAVWTIPYEFGCYLLTAAAGVAGLLRPKVALTLLGLAVAAGVGMAATGWGPDVGRLEAVLQVPAQWPPFLAYFWAGAAFYLWRRHVPHSLGLAAGAAGLLAAGVFVPLAWRALLPTCGAYLLFWVAFHPRLPLHGFGRFGDFSYGTYLYAWSIQQLLVLWLGPRLSAPGLFALAAPASVAAGVASWYLVEKPFMALKGPRSVPPADEPQAFDDAGAVGERRGPSYDPNPES